MENKLYEQRNGQWDTLGPGFEEGRSIEGCSVLILLCFRAQHNKVAVDLPKKTRAPVLVSVGPEYSHFAPMSFYIFRMLPAI